MHAHSRGPASAAARAAGPSRAAAPLASARRQPREVALSPRRHEVGHDEAPNHCRLKPRRAPVPPDGRAAGVGREECLAGLRGVRQGWLVGGRGGGELARWRAPLPLATVTGATPRPGTDGAAARPGPDRRNCPSGMRQRTVQLACAGARSRANSCGALALRSPTTQVYPPVNPVALHSGSTASSRWLQGWQGLVELQRSCSLAAAGRRPPASSSSSSRALLSRATAAPIWYKAAS